MISNIIKKYINKRMYTIVDDLITLVSDLTDSVEDLNDRTVVLEKIVNNSLKPKYTIKDGKIEMG